MDIEKLGCHQDEAETSELCERAWCCARLTSANKPSGVAVRSRLYLVRNVSSLLTGPDLDRMTVHHGSVLPRYRQGLEAVGHNLDQIIVR